MSTLKPLWPVYEGLCRQPSDIQDHLPTLRAFATNCTEVVELGARYGFSTIALLAGQPDYLLSIDINPLPHFLPNTTEKGRTKFEFQKGDSREVEIPECDVLFIDTFHTYDQLKRELAIHPRHVRSWILLHDTATFGDTGELLGSKGLRPAVKEFMWDNPNWRIALDLPYCNGLMVLQKF